MNLTANPNDPSELAFHVIDSLMPLVMRSWPEGARLNGAFEAKNQVLDLGSGAGFPGLVLAAASSAHFTLVEVRRKRASFLSIAAAEMDLRNCAVDASHRQAEDFDARFNTITARAFGKPAEFYRIAAAALRRAGRAILYANPDQQLDHVHAETCGLAGYTAIPYEIRRKDRPVKRILAVWRKH